MGPLGILSCPPLTVRVMHSMSSCAKQNCIKFSANIKHLRMWFSRMFRFWLFQGSILYSRRKLHFQITTLQHESSLHHVIDACGQLNFKGHRPSSNCGRAAVCGKTSASAL